MKTNCKGLTVKGKPCKNKVSKTKEYCHIHIHSQKKKITSPEEEFYSIPQYHSKQQQQEQQHSTPQKSTPKRSGQVSLDQHLKLSNSCEKLAILITSKDIDSSIKTWAKEQQEATKILFVTLSHVANNVSVNIINNSILFLSSTFIEKLTQAFEIIYKLIHKKAYKPKLTNTEFESKVWRYIYNIYYKFKKSWPIIKQITYTSLNVLAYTSSLYYTVGYFIYSFSTNRLLTVHNDFISSTLKASTTMIKNFYDKPTCILFIAYIFFTNDYFRKFISKIEPIIGITVKFSSIVQILLPIISGSWVKDFILKQFTTTIQALTGQEIKQQVQISTDEKNIHNAVLGFGDIVKSLSRGYKSKISEKISIQDLKYIYQEYSNKVLSSRSMVNQIAGTTGVIIRDIHLFINKYNTHIVFSSLIFLIIISGLIMKKQKNKSHRQNQEIDNLIKNFRLTKSNLTENDIDYLISSLSSCLNLNQLIDCNKIINF
jgi:hypothetical protein